MRERSRSRPKSSSRRISKAAELTIEGTLGYQACDDRSCLPPASVAFSRKVAVAGTAERRPSRRRMQRRPCARRKSAPANPKRRRPPGSGQPGRCFEPHQKEKAAAPAANAAATAQRSRRPFDNKGLFLTFILVFLGGLALNLTPCIYPLIPITISYFGGQAQGKEGERRPPLGPLCRRHGHDLLHPGRRSPPSPAACSAPRSRYPPVLIGIALVMVLLALSMFNVYELRVPAFLNKFAGGSQKGFFGTFFMGLTCGIIAAPCIGPFVLGLLTYVGNRGNVLLGFSPVLRPGPGARRSVPVPRHLLGQPQPHPALGRLDGLGPDDLRLHPHRHGHLFPENAVSQRAFLQSRLGLDHARRGHLYGLDRADENGRARPSPMSGTSSA